MLPQVFWLSLYDIRARNSWCMPPAAPDRFRMIKVISLKLQKQIRGDHRVSGNQVMSRADENLISFLWAIFALYVAPHFAFHRPKALCGKLWPLPHGPYWPWYNPIGKSSWTAFIVSKQKPSKSELVQMTEVTICLLCLGLWCEQLNCSCDFKWIWIIYMSQSFEGGRQYGVLLEKETILIMNTTLGFWFNRGNARDRFNRKRGVCCWLQYHNNSSLITGVYRHR